MPGIHVDAHTVGVVMLDAVLHTLFLVNKLQGVGHARTARGPHTYFDAETLSATLYL